MHMLTETPAQVWDVVKFTRSALQNGPADADSGVA